MNKFSIFLTILNIFKGIVIGTGAILPGVSGGVLSVTLGLYKPIMNFLAHPLRNIRLLKVLLPAGIGGALGMILFARLVEWLFQNQYNLAVWLFVGLIVGTLPGLWRESGRYKRTKGSWAALAASFAVLLAILTMLKYSGGIQIVPSTFWWVVCGVLWGLAMIVPGLSHSSLLVFLGLYEPMASGIANLALPVIIPMGIGLITSVLLLARLVKSLFDKVPSIAYHCVIGIILGSTIAIIPSWQGGIQILYNAISLCVGLAVALLMGLLESKTSESKSAHKA